MKNISTYIASILFVGSLMVSCESTELDLTQDPNFLSPEQASPDFFLNSIQEDFARLIEGDADNDPNDNFVGGGNVSGDGFSILGSELTRLMPFGARDYRGGYQDIDTDDEWDNAYRGILFDIRLMTPVAEESSLTHHLGIAQFIEAYTLVTLVDFFGDIPYSEALHAPEILNPTLDSGESVYAAALSLLDQAISNFSSDSASEPPTDYFYGGDYDKWVNAANTLKLKIYVQTRLVDPSAAASFNAIINSGNYIMDTADDFDWFWPGTSASQPDVRHPRFGINYASAGGTDYISNWLTNLIDTSGDPRLRYYFYRQTLDVPNQDGFPPDEELLTCSLQTPPAHYVSGGFTFCALPNGYWGRDHGDDEGTPPDGLLRSTFGVYPAGGRFDDDSFSEIAQSNNTDSFGAGGVGITPILDAFMVDFWRAEMALAANQPGAAATHLESALTKQIAKVRSFVSNDGGADLSFEPTSTDVTDFIDATVAAFNGASGDDQWDVLAEQYFVSHYGNGIETYNFYRRTGYPTTLQPNREPDPGAFIRSMYYPNQAVTSNSNITQKSDQTVQVFWDTNPASGFPFSN
ncbi:SusD/RagB family nutrient-binding outer membrane lipoprotein [Muricauda sp. CAU 1633]|uniref:SusD/RagB family nutrient-binding outer membrane lipoprotein n=1 Tax=Allomuricauda sp. CAU 1633 TaxID=2816036 RepID=UPI001A90BF1F|nr:SusD/RagB family nutrient-binding outer membrane lipoprotein [Muricauda sp. CAU 1633]MBO0321537.1 SusD/RagB family nutrient-binding outer membrane lipoprotein [Muricauda sp. CAU 1633]